MGAFAATSREVKDFLINTARSFIFSTMLPPMNAAWSLFIWRRLKYMGAARRKLAEISEKVRLRIEEITGQPNPSRSQIIPLMAGSNQRALWLSQELKRCGIMALPIRKPTVPAGTERLRLSLSSDLTESQVDYVLEKIAEIYRECLELD